MQRAVSRRVHSLRLDMPTPQKQVILSVTKNKVQLNAMLSEALLDSGFYAQATSQNSLIIAGVTDVPIQITHDLKINRQNLRSSHEEPYVIIAQLAVAMSLEDQSVCVVCDDTDVFVLLVHFYNRMCLNQAPMIMDHSWNMWCRYGGAALHKIVEAMALKVARKSQFSLSAIGYIEASNCMDSCHVTSRDIHICCI